MCGLVGWFRLDVAHTERMPMLRDMCAAIAHRGPDDRGSYADDDFGLGFQRLSIVDLESGHQPMANDDGRIVMGFNGEIYNHLDLQEDLIRQGRSFRTRSDTEVILRLYEAVGIEGLARLNGMFAIVIWDKRQGVLHLVRDRLGIKPLYYARVGHALLFGSEIKALLASGRIGRSVNRRAVWDYLTFRYVPAPQTIWEKVFKLPPAHRLEYRLADDEPRVGRWWDMPVSTPELEVPDRHYEEQFRFLFEDAVKRRLQADVPVGITLSGGLDSSAVVAAAGPPSPHTFSVAFKGAADTDERAYARMVAEAFSARHHEVVIDREEFLGFLPDFVWYTDEPLADLASVPLYYVSRLARQQVKVVLSGEGADEILAGYDFGRWAQLWDQVCAAKAAAMGSGRLFSVISPLFSASARRRRALAATVVDQRQVAEPISMTRLWSSAQKREMLLFPGEWPDSMDGIRHCLDRLGDHQTPLNQVLYSYCQDWLVEDLLMKADRMSMANSLELRTPFLDYRLVEWAARLPVRLKVGNAESGYRTKEILRRYAAERLPRAVLERPKQGFPVPVYGWLTQGLAAWAKEMLLDPASHLAAWIRPVALQAVLRQGTEPGADSLARHRLWNLLILEIWMRRWLP